MNFTLKHMTICAATLLAASQNVQAATIGFYDTYDFKLFGTIDRDDHIYVAPTSFSEIGRLSQFDPALGTLTGVSVYSSFVGAFALTSHCSGVPCWFETRASFSDGMDYSPPGANFSNTSYTMTARLTQDGGCNFTRTNCSNSATGNTDASEEVQVSSDYFDDYVGNGDVTFGKGGFVQPRVRIYHTRPFIGTRNFQEACIDDCGDFLGGISLAGYILSQLHLGIYNDAHYEYSGRRYFQVNYTYEPHLQPVPIPAPLALFLTGLVGLGIVGRRRKKSSA